MSISSHHVEALVQWFWMWMLWMTLIPSNTLTAFSVLKTFIYVQYHLQYVCFLLNFFILIRPSRLLTNFAVFVKIYNWTLPLINFRQIVSLISLLYIYIYTHTYLYIIKQMLLCNYKLYRTANLVHKLVSTILFYYCCGKFELCTECIFNQWIYYNHLFIYIYFGGINK